MAKKDSSTPYDRSGLNKAGDEFLDLENMGEYVNPRKRKIRMGTYMVIVSVVLVVVGLTLYLIANKEFPELEKALSESQVVQPQEVQKEKEPVVDVDEVNKAADAAGNEDGEAATKEEKDGKEEQIIDSNSIAGQMVKALSGYFSATSIEQKLQYVLDPRRVEPMMYNYYSRVRFYPQEIQQLTPPRSFSIEGAAFWRTQIAFRDGSVAFVAMRIVDGEPKIDWESQVRYCSRDWTNWVDDKSVEEGDFRVYAVLDQYYPKPFDNTSRYMCVKLTTMDSPRSIFAYFDREDPSQKDLILQLESGSKQECTLRLQQVASGAASPVAKVVKVLSPSWIIVEKNS